MSGATQAIESSATAVVEGFESIPHRLKLLGERIAEGIAHPFAPPVVKETLPLLMGILQTMSQEIAELRVPCPCKPAATSATTAAPEATAAPTLAEDMTAKWPTYEAALAAFQAGQMSEAEAAAFEPVHAKVVAFAASVTGA